MFDDLRRGFTKDIQGLTEFKRSKIAQKSTIFKRFCLFDLQNDLKIQI